MNRVIRKKMLCTLFFALFSLAGCGLSNGQEKDVETLNTIVFNYTQYERIYGIGFLDAAKEYHRDKAASEGCCFMWNTKQSRPITLRVIWAVVFDEKKYKGGFGFDEYTNRKTRPGVAWCEAFVPIRHPYPANPGEFILEFFPDGSVKAHFTAVSDPPEASMMLPKERYNSLPRLPDGQPCLKQISNPLYGLDRPKHYE